LSEALALPKMPHLLVCLRFLINRLHPRRLVHLQCPRGKQMIQLHRLPLVLLRQPW
jgi:hypothetical protein